MLHMCAYSGSVIQYIYMNIYNSEKGRQGPKGVFLLLGKVPSYKSTTMLRQT